MILNHLVVNHINDANRLPIVLYRFTVRCILIVDDEQVLRSSNRNIEQLQLGADVPKFSEDVTMLCF